VPPAYAVTCQSPLSVLSSFRYLIGVDAVAELSACAAGKRQMRFCKHRHCGRAAIKT